MLRGNVRQQVCWVYRPRHGSESAGGGKFVEIFKISGVEIFLSGEKIRKIMHFV